MGGTDMTSGSSVLILKVVSLTIAKRRVRAGTVLIADGGLVSLLVEIDVAKPEDGGDDLEE
jgi:hypothetical protein